MTAAGARKSWDRRVRTGLIAAAVALAAIALPASAGATFPGRDGMIAFSVIRWTGVPPEAPATGGIYAFRPGWEDPRQLTDDPSDVPSSFSPSGRRLVFARNEGDASGIYSLRADGSGLTRLTSEPPFSYPDPSFGRHGEIVFVRFDPEEGVARASLTPVPPRGFDHLFLRQRNGRIRQLTSGPVGDGAPVFTPDGKRILFIRGPGRRSTSPTPHVFSIRPDGTGLHPLAGRQCGISSSRYGGSLDSSPDGRRFAFPVFEADPTSPCDDIPPGTWSESTTGGNPAYLASEVYGTYSPSGRRIAFSDEGIRVKELGSRDPGEILVPDDCEIEDCPLRVFGPVWQPLPRKPRPLRHPGTGKR
jgi:WD40-like Beta Propeller Repeat